MPLEHLRPLKAWHLRILQNRVRQLQEQAWQAEAELAGMVTRREFTFGEAQANFAWVRWMDARKALAEAYGDE